MIINRAKEFAERRKNVMKELEKNVVKNKLFEKRCKTVSRVSMIIGSFGLMILAMGRVILNIVDDPFEA